MVTWSSSTSTWTYSGASWAEAANSRDTILNLIKTNYSVTASQTVIAQWNHNRYNNPLIFGYYRSNATASSGFPISSSDRSISSIYTTTTAETPVTLTGTSPVTIGTYSTSMNSTYQLDNAVRIMFDAKITSITSDITEDISEFLLRIIPKNGGNSLTDYVDMANISLVEGVYTKQSILFSSNYYDIDRWFDQVQLSLKSVNDLAGGTVVVTIKNVCIAPVTRDEISESQFESLPWIFHPNRPGDQIVENDLISPKYNPITKYFIIGKYFNEAINYPNLLPTFISPYNEKNYFLSPMTRMVTTSIESDGTTGATEYSDRNGHNIFVEYASAVPTNQIYIKTQNFSTGTFDQRMISDIDKVEVYIKNSSGTWGTSPVASYTSGNIISNGAVVLQYNGSTWSQGYNSLTLPQINATTGSLSNYVDVKGIHVVFYATAAPSRMRVVELSPRLAVNLSNFLISTNHDTSIDDGSQRVPVGLLNVGNSEIVLENLPRWTSPTSESGSLYQIFNNNINSPLNGLIKPDTKFTVYTTITDTKNSASSGTVKNFTMYAEQWENKEIETVTISLNDYGKILQSAPAPDLFLTTNQTPKKAGTFQNSVEALLQLGGFSDYDIDSASTVSKLLKKRAQGTIPIFYSSKERKIWDVLSELCVGYQVSAFFDENGILQFRDLLRETGTYTSYSTGSKFYLTSSATNNYIPNIISLSLENKPDVGELTVNYKQMSMTNNFYDANGNIFPQNSGTSMKIETPAFKKESNSPNSPFSPPNTRALICANVIANVSATDTRILVGDYNHIDKAESRFVTSFKGYGILEGEIISWDGLAYSFTPITGFPTVEVIRSQDELADAVSKRFNYLGNQEQIIRFQLTGSSATPYLSASFSATHELRVGQKVQLSIVPYNISYNKQIYNQSARVMATTATTAQFLISPGGWNYIYGYHAGNGGLPTSRFPIMYRAIDTDITYSWCNRGDLALHYNMTGSLCNVRRGLFGTSATDHFTQNVYDATAFLTYGSQSTAPPATTIGRTMEKTNEVANATYFPISIKPKGITYLGFYQRDRKDFIKYRYVFTPTKDVDSFGLFFGADMTGTTTKSFTTGTGYFIEFFPPTNSSNWGATIRSGSNPTNPILYVSEQKALNDTWVADHYVWIPIKDKNGKVIKDENDKPKKMKKLIKTPPKRNVITVEFKNQKINKIIVNGKTIKFYPKTAITNDGTKIDKKKAVGSAALPKLSINKNYKTFGIFSRNTDQVGSVIKINEIQAAGWNQPMDRTITWETGGNMGFQQDIDIILEGISDRKMKNGRAKTGFRHPVKPFSLRATPFIRGIEWNEEKWEGDLPYYDLTARTISGLNGKQLVHPSDVDKSIVLGTPFRGRWAYKNNINEVVYTKADQAEYLDEKIDGKSINVSEERKITRVIDDQIGNEKIEVNLQWSNGEGTAQNVLDDILKNISTMNTIYNIEIYGNPAIKVGDYITLNYPESGIIDRNLVVISTKNEFSDGGISTSLVLRDPHR